MSFLGKQHTASAKKKIAASNSRRVISDATREKMRQAKLKRVIFQCEQCQSKIELRPCEARNRKYCSMKCTYESPDYRTKRAKIGAEICRKREWTDEQREIVGKRFAGENNANWKGGITPINAAARQTKEIRRWRKDVLNRDDYKCVGCGSGEELHVDHIKPFATFPELRADIENGRTLCVDCHRATPTYGGRALAGA